MSMKRIDTPFTPEQVARLNAYQQAGKMHPFTCPRCAGSPSLIADVCGWTCPRCDYTQDWAHAFMASGVME